MNAQKELYFLQVNMDDLVNFDEDLATALRKFPTDYLQTVSSPINPLVRRCS
jgi:hypothetical protein